MKNTVESRMNPNYKMHMLEKYECMECERHLILSMKETDEASGIRELQPRCPYCGSYNIESVSYLDDQDILDELGCLGIGYLEYEEEKEESSMAIIKRVHIYNTGGCDSRLIVSDKDLIHGAEEYDYEEATLVIKEETMKEWAAEQRIMDSQEENYVVVVEQIINKPKVE